MKNVDGPAVRLADDTDAALAAMPTELAVTLVDIAAACREGLMAVAVEAGLATAMAIMNHPGSDGGSFYWFPTPTGSACWAA